MKEEIFVTVSVTVDGKEYGLRYSLEAFNGVQIEHAVRRLINKLESEKVISNENV